MADPIDLDRLDALHEKERKSQYLTDAEVTQLRNALPALLAEVRALRGKLDEREGDMHLRIRAGYDKTVADSWRREVARVEKERDELRAEREKTEASLLRLSDAYRFSSSEVPGYLTRFGLWREPKETTNG